MIERAVINGRSATVAYVKLPDWTPTTPERADAVQVLFDNGDTMFATLDPKANDFAELASSALGGATIAPEADG